MSSNRKPETDLTLLLRRGDPAAEGEGLPPADAALMRRTMLAEIEAAGRPPRLRWRPVLAAACGAALVFALAIARWNLEDEPPAAPSEEPRAPALAGTGIASPPSPAGPQEITPGASAAPPRRARPVPSAARKAPASPPEAAVRAARQIDFETPGGTRVVWVLDPDFSLHPTEVQTR